MNFLVDNQLPQALARWLVDQGHQAVHVLDVQMAQTGDIDIWRYAAQTGYVILAKDEDFANFAVLRAEPVQVVWIRVGNCRNDVLFATMAVALPAILAQLTTGQRLVEVYR